METKEKKKHTQTKLKVRKRKSRSCPSSPNRQQDSPEKPAWKVEANKALKAIVKHADAKLFLKPSQKMPKGRFFDACVLKLENDMFTTQSQFRLAVFEVVDFWLGSETHRKQAQSLEEVVNGEITLKPSESKSRKRKFEKAFGVKGKPSPRKRKKKPPATSLQKPVVISSDDEENFPSTQRPKTTKKRAKKAKPIIIDDESNQFPCTQPAKKEKKNLKSQKGTTLKTDEKQPLRKRKKKPPPKKVVSSVKKRKIEFSDDSEGDTEEIASTPANVSQVIPSSQTPEKKRKRKSLDFDRYSKKVSADNADGLATPAARLPCIPKLTKRIARKNKSIREKKNRQRPKILYSIPKPKEQIDLPFNESLEGVKIEAHGLCLAGDAKPWNQDSFAFQQFKQRCSVLSLFDGHGLVGHNASNHCAAYFPLVLANEIESITENTPESVQNAIFESIMKVHKNLCFMTKNEQEMFSLFYRANLKAVDYGATLSNILALPGGNVYISTVGDSRVMLLKIEGKAATKFWWSKDHNIQTLPKEQDRVIRAGGRIEKKGFAEYRLLPDTSGKKYRFLGINMTRAVGHHILSEYGLSPNPDHYHLQVEKGTEYLAIAASDGLWDVVKNDRVAEITSKFLQKGPEIIANELVKESRIRWRKYSPKCDDTTIVVCKLIGT